MRLCYHRGMQTRRCVNAKWNRSYLLNICRPNITRKPTRIERYCLSPVRCSCRISKNTTYSRVPDANPYDEKKAISDIFSLPFTHRAIASRFDQSRLRRIPSIRWKFLPTCVLRSRLQSFHRNFIFRRIDIFPQERLRNLPAISLPLFHSRMRFRRRRVPSRCRFLSATPRRTCTCKSRTGTSWFWTRSALRRCRRQWQIYGTPPRGTCTCGQIVDISPPFISPGTA